MSFNERKEIYLSTKEKEIKFPGLDSKNENNGRNILKYYFTNLNIVVFWVTCSN